MDIGVEASTSGPALPADAPPEALVPALLAWYDRARRRLPWRALPGEPVDPYAVLVSELMLQQTTVATVRERYPAFLARFPSFDALAAADLDQVLHAWQGLGYYRRARALHAAARLVVARHGGRLPEDAAALAALPGLGPYTVAALRAIAFAAPTVPVDGNVARVLARLCAIRTALPQALPAIRAEAAKLAGAHRPGDVAQALMDLGAMVCTPRRPACMACPWQPACRAQALGIAEQLPAKAPRAARPLLQATAFLLVRADGAILLRRRPETGLLAGMVELPTTPWREGPAWREEEARALAPMAADWTAVPGVVRHVFTHLMLDCSLLAARVAEGPPGLWATGKGLDDLALPTLTLKLLRLGGVTAATRPGSGSASARARR